MRSIPYSKLETGVAAIAGIDPTSILSHEKVLLAEYINDAVKFCWDYYPWAEFTKTEIRYFRDEYDANTSYSAGAEVYYNGKYYRSYLGAAAGVLPTEVRNWVEVGDIDAAPEWSESGVYYIGAKVKYNDKLYLVVNESEFPDIPYCFEIDGKLPDQHFSELDENFDRFIAYEQAGKDVIGTCLSITLDDPRYNDTTPLNWREDREGIYIEPHSKTFNKVWLRYRLEAPTYTSESTTEEVPNFLAQAIKAYAYKAWLIADGQHEKAQLQDIYGLDLLVRELDKLDNQQDRAAPFTITKEPYRRLNAKQGLVAPVTQDKIGSIKSASVTCTATISTNTFGKNAVVKAIIDGDPIFEIIVFAINPVQKGLPACHLRISTSSTGKNAAKYGIVESTTKITTGKAYRSINIGQVRGLKLRVVLSPPMSSGFNVKTQARGRNVVRQSNVRSTGFDVSVSANAKNIVGQGSATLPVIIYSAANGKNLVKKSDVSSGILVALIGKGKSSVYRGRSTAQVQMQTAFRGVNIVKQGTGVSTISVETETEYRRERKSTATSEITYQITNGMDSTVQLYNTRTSPQTDAFLDTNVRGYPSGGNAHDYIWFNTMGRHTTPINSNTSYIDPNEQRLAHVTTAEFFNRNQQFKLVHIDEFGDETFFGNKSEDWRNLLHFGEAGGSTFNQWGYGSSSSNNVHHNMLMIGQTPIDIYLPATPNGDSAETTQAYIIAYFAEPRFNYGGSNEFLPLAYPTTDIPTNMQRSYGAVDETVNPQGNINEYNLPLQGAFGRNELEFNTGSASNGDPEVFTKNIAYQVRFRLLVENALPDLDLGFAPKSDLRLHDYGALLSVQSPPNLTSGTYTTLNPVERLVSISGGYWIDRNYPIISQIHSNQTQASYGKLLSLLHSNTQQITMPLIGNLAMKYSLTGSTLFHIM